MRVRLFRQEDARQCSSIIRRNFRTHLKNEDPKPTVERLIKLNSPARLIAKAKEGKYFVAVDGEKVIGMGGYIGDMLRRFFVHPDYHKQGVGRRLMNRVLREMKKEGVKTVHANSTSFAEKFYESCGFKRLRKHTFPFAGSTITYIHMKKKI